MISAKKGWILIDSIIMMLIVTIIITLTLNMINLVKEIELKYDNEKLQETRFYLD